MIPILFTLFLLTPANLHALTGFDWDTGCEIEIEEDDPLTEDSFLTIYDYSDANYHDVQILDITKQGTKITELDVYERKPESWRSVMWSGL